MTSLRIAAALLLCFIAGTGAILLVTRRNSRVCVVELIAFGWLLGTAIISTLLVVGGIFLSGPALVCSVAMVSFLLGALGFQRLTSLSFWLWPNSTGAFGKVLSACLLVPIALLFVNCFSQPLFWDGLLIWEFKARVAFLNGGGFPAEYFAREGLEWSKPSYPLYLPALEAWLYLWLGEPHQYFVKILFPFFPWVAAAVLWCAAVRLSGSASLGAAAALLVFCVPALTNGIGPLHGYADVPLGVYFLSACYLLFLSNLEGHGRQVVLAALLGGCLPWIKTEGIFLWIGFAAVSLCLLRKRLGVALLVPAPGLVAFGAWQLALKILNTPSEGVFRPIDLETLMDALGRIPVVTGRIGRELISGMAWGILWPVAFAVVGWHLWRRREWGAAIALMLLLPLGMDILPYLFTDMPLVWHMDNSIQRLVLQLAPAALLGIVLSLRNYAEVRLADVASELRKPVKDGESC